MATTAAASAPLYPAVRPPRSGGGQQVTGGATQAGRRTGAWRRAGRGGAPSPYFKASALASPRNAAAEEGTGPAAHSPPAVVHLMGGMPTYTAATRVTPRSALHWDGRAW